MHPETTTEALQVSSDCSEQAEHKKIMSTPTLMKKKDPDEISFAQMTTEQKKKMGSCFECGKEGHFAKDCPNQSPELPNVAAQHFQ